MSRRRSSDRVLVICLAALLAAGLVALAGLGVLMTLDVHALTQMGRR